MITPTKFPKNQEMSLNNQRKAAGSHYTPQELATFVARQIVKAGINRSKNDFVSVLDPAAGEGQLLTAIIRELSENGFVCITANGFDTDTLAIKEAEQRLQREFPTIPINLICSDFLSASANSNKKKVKAAVPTLPSEKKYDVVIANPPYVRTQVMGAEQSQALAKQFGLSGRVDLYHAFLQRMAKALEPGGLAGIITSNRFMTTKSGADVRKNISEQFDILHIWDLGDTRLFEAAVLPAVLLLRKKNGEPNLIHTGFTSVYSTTNQAVATHCTDIFEALDKRGVVSVKEDRCFVVQQGKLDYGDDPCNVWRIATKASDYWLQTVEVHTSLLFRDIGKIRVGVKTTADKVYIRSDWNMMPEPERPELLRPLTTHHIARRFKALDPTKQILYPHQVINGNRSAAALGNFPRTAQYLEKHRSILEARDYVMQAGRNWYEIWVPQDPSVWPQTKLVFRDITETPTFWLDLDGTVVNGDCYWLVDDSGNNPDLLWLALAIGNSTFIEAFYDHKFNNKLYAGRRRFMTQYVEKFPLPDPSSKIAMKIIRIAKSIYDLIPSLKTKDLEKKLDKLVWKSFGF